MFIRFVLLSGIIAFAPFSHAETLRLNDAINLAIAKQPILSSQQAVIDANQQTEIADTQLPDPKLKLGINNLPTDTYSLTQDSMTQRSVSIEQSFPGGNKRQLRGQLAKAETDLSRTELAANIRDIRRSVALAWLDAYYPVRELQLIHEQQHAFQQQIKAARIDYRASKGSQEAVLDLQNGLDQLKDKEIDLTAQAGQARAQLRRWIGLDADRPLPESLPALPSPVPLPQLLAQLDRHPEILKFNQTIASAEADMALAKEARKPDWSVELGYSKRGPAYADMVSAQVAMDLPLFPHNRQDRTTAAKQYMVTKSVDAREDRMRSLQADLSAAYVNWQAATQRINLLQQSTLSNASQRVSAAIIGYGSGGTTMGNVYEAHHAKLEASLQLLAQQVAQLRAQIQLAYFTNGEFDK